MSVQNSPFFARLLYAAFFIAAGWFLCSKFLACKQKAQIPLIQAKLTARLNAVALRIDSLTEANDSLTGWIIAYQSQKPIIKYHQKEIFLTDTVWQTERLTDTLTQDRFVYVENPTTKIREVGLRLPASFTLSNPPHLQIIGTIDTIGVHADSIRLINNIALRDDIKRSFFQERHTLSFAQSNPYVSSIVPTYIYQKPTKRGEILKKLGWFAIGLGTGYGIRAIQK